MSFLRGIYGVNSSVISSIKKAGITSPIDYLLSDLEQIAKEGDCSYRELQSVRSVVTAQLAALPITGDVLLKDATKSTVVFSTGSSRLDAALGGGVLRSEVLEVFGKSGVGKTQLCARMAAKQATLGRRVLYLDTAAAIIPSMLMEIFSRLNAEVTEELLQLIQVCHPRDIWEAISSLSSVLASSDPPALLVLDSVAAYMLPAVAATQGTGAVCQLSSVLRQIANRSNAVVLLVMHDSDLPHGNVLARIWQHVPAIRVEVQRPEQVSQFRVTKATRLAVNKGFTPV
uniref:DNA repair protein RAD51 homolog 4-like n=2 Tax=Hirondellea gigas TaxID=1518452 RepID=A0A6A7FYY5_9CRUS